MFRVRPVFLVGLLALVTAWTVSTANAQSPRNNWYVSALGGPNFVTADPKGTVTDPTLPPPVPIKFDVNAGFVAGGAVGYSFPFGLNIEGEVSYRRNAIDDFTARTTNFKSLGAVVDGSVSILALMANAIYVADLGEGIMGGRLKPYAGAGLGAAFVRWDVGFVFFGSSNQIVDDTATALAY